ncbi:MAG: HAMP domain-containing histidine kinase [Treponema sp.]|nr:HAMP domain-containing histidine kinase [Treponema sp.]
MIDVKHSLTVKLAAKLTLLFTLTSIIIVYIYTVVLWNNIKNQKQEELLNALSIIEKSLDKNDVKDIKAGFVELPYYIDFIIYRYDENGNPLNEDVFQTNNPYLPHLDITDNKLRHHKERLYFGDSDLNIFYISSPARYLTSDIVIQVSINMDSDSATNMFSHLAWIIFITLIPIIIFSFIGSAFLTKRTTEPLKRELKRERQFTSDVSHELRTPVAVISGQANLLRRWGKDDPAQLEKSLAMIISEANSMEMIISNLLQMSRLERGAIVPEKVILLAEPLMERLKKETLVIKPDCKFNYNVSKDLKVFTDEELLHQVFTVVISNSLKYCDDPIEININCRKDKAKKVIMTISDNGKGFEDKIIEHIFERFYRGDDSHNRNAGGCGLGLSIARTIVEALGGNIRASNVEKGHGAVITIVL